MLPKLRGQLEEQEAALKGREVCHDILQKGLA
jgi:hypothetical protein